MANTKKYRVLSPLSITLVYLVFGILWIAFTDHILTLLLDDPTLLSIYQTYKGWIFVSITSLGLFYVVHKHQDQLKLRETEREALIEKLRSEKELKDVLFDRIPVMIAIYDPDFEEFRINKEMVDVCGWSINEAKEINFMEACFPDREVREEVVDFMNSPGVGWKEFNLTTKSGDIVPTSWTNVRLTDDTSVGIGIDMTEMKSSQAKIRESQKLLKKTVESLKSSLILVDPETRTIIDCNNATEQLFGYDREELVGDSTRKLHVNQEKYREFDEIGKKDLKEKGEFQTEFQMQRKDGTVFYTDHTVTLVYDEERVVDKVVSVIRDITEQKKYKTKLEHRHQRLLRSQKIGQMGDWEYNLDTGEVSWSPMMYEIFERDPELGPPDFETIGEKYYRGEKELPNERLEKAIEKNESYEIDVKIITEKNNTKYIHAVTKPAADITNGAKKAMGVVIDITKRKELELALEENKQRIQAITNNVPGVVFRYTLHPDGTEELNYISDGAEKIWGITAEEARANINKIWENFPASDRKNIQQSIRESAAALTPWDEEWRYQKPDGSLHWHKGNGIPHKSDDGSVVWDSIIIDITEKKKIHENIISSVIEGEDRERKRIAHELHDGLGQYLVAANMNFESAKEEAQNLPGKRKKQFNTGLSFLKKALSETRSIAYNLMPKAIADYGLITALQNLIEDVKNSTNINLEFDCNCKELKLKDQAEIDIYRICQETISNSVRHAECKNIFVTLTKRGNILSLVIEDDGTSPRGTEESKKQGLGFRSIKTRVRNLNGRLFMNSASEEGMQTSIIIPDIQNLLKKGA